MSNSIDSKNKSFLLSTSGRIDFIDVFRGIGIILMVAGHVGLTSEFSKLIHSFHMPMFFFISGFFFKDNQNFKNVLIKKSRTLLIPYFVFGIIISIFYIFKEIMFGNGIDASDAVSILKCFLWDNSVGLPPVWAMWFLTALFFTDIFYFLISKYIKNDVLKSLVVLAAAVFGNLETVLLPFRLPWSMGAAFVGLGFFHIGVMLKKYENSFISRNLLNMKWYLWLPLAVLCLFLIYKNDYVDMRSGYYAFIPLFWVNAVLSSCLIFNFSKVITRFFNDIKILMPFTEYLKAAGKNSIVYVCLNQLVIAVLVEIADKFASFSSDISFIAVFVLTLISLWFLAEIITKSKLKIVIGK